MSTSTIFFPFMTGSRRTSRALTSPASLGHLVVEFGGVGQKRPRALHRFAEPLPGDGLQQVVDRVDLEGLDGVLVEGSGEDDERDVRQRVHDLETVHPRHLNVEYDDVGVELACHLDRPKAVLGLARDLDVRGCRPGVP